MLQCWFAKVEVPESNPTERNSNSWIQPYHNPLSSVTILQLQKIFHDIFAAPCEHRLDGLIIGKKEHLQSNPYWLLNVPTIWIRLLRFCRRAKLIRFQVKHVQWYYISETETAFCLKILTVSSSCNQSICFQQKGKRLFGTID